MLEMNCVDDNFKMLATVLAILVTNIHIYISVGHQHSKDVTNIQKLLPTSLSISYQYTISYLSILVFVLVMLIIGLGIGIRSLPDVEDDKKTAKELVDEVFEKNINDTILF